MSRIKGLAPFSANFEPQIASPLDARATVQYKSDLILTSTWQANDGLVYTYKGMLVVVKDDTEENNGIYVLNNTDYTDIDNWIKYSAGGTSGNRFKRVDIEAIPIGNLGVTALDQLTFDKIRNKYMPSFNELCLLFLFEVYQEGTGILGTDLTFADDVALKDFLDLNADFHNSVVVRCYYYEDTDITCMLPIRGFNWGYSILRSGTGYYNAKIKTMNDNYTHMLWANRDQFITDLFQYAHGFTPSNLETAAGAIYFPRNKDKIYVHHRDDYSTLIDESKSPNKLMFSNDGLSFIANGGVEFTIMESFYVTFNRNGYGPTTYLLANPSNNVKKFDMLFGSESIVKVYKLKHIATGYNALFVKPAGMDTFWCHGASIISPINIIGVGTGAYNKQQKFKVLTNVIQNHMGSNVVATIHKDTSGITRLFGSKNQINNPSRNSLLDVEIMYNYGNGYFSKRSNRIKLITNARGINSQLLV